jgi:hypothetical protein
MKRLICKFGKIYNFKKMKKILIVISYLDYSVYYRAQVKHHNQVQSDN